MLLFRYWQQQRHRPPPPLQTSLLEEAVPVPGIVDPLAAAAVVALDYDLAPPLEGREIETSTRGGRCPLPQRRSTWLIR